MLFYLKYEYDKIAIKDENRRITGYDIKIAEVAFGANNSKCDHDEYYISYDEFLMTNILIPSTGLKLYRWSDVSNESDNNEKRSAKMARMLLYDSGQKFIKVPQ